MSFYVYSLRVFVTSYVQVVRDGRVLWPMLYCTANLILLIVVICKTTSGLHAINSGRCTTFHRVGANRCYSVRSLYWQCGLSLPAVSCCKKSVIRLQLYVAIVGTRYAHVCCSNRVRWLASTKEMEWFYRTEYMLRIVLVRSLTDEPISGDFLVFSNYWFQGILTKFAHVRVAWLTVLKYLDRGLQSLPFLLALFRLSSPMKVNKVLGKFFRWFQFSWFRIVPYHRNL